MAYEFKGTGQEFGAHTIVGKSQRGGSTYWWVCQCKGGEKRVVGGQRLVNGCISTCISCEVKHNMEKPIK